MDDDYRAHHRDLRTDLVPLLPERPDDCDGNRSDAAMTDLAQLNRETLSQRAYNHISTQLIDGSMSPGEKLILRPLAAQLGLSATPVREALLRLVSEQALELDGRGSVVVPVMSAEQVREMCEMRADLEVRAAQRAAEVVRRSDLARLQPVCDESVSTFGRGNHQDVLAANARFHRMICQIGRSLLIQRTLQGLWIRLGPSYALALAEPVASFPVGEHPHEMMMAALRSGDIDGSREAALQDVRVSERVLNRILLPDEVEATI